MNFSNKLKLCAPKPARTQSPKPSDCAKTHPYCLKNFDLISGGADYIEGITGFA